MKRVLRYATIGALGLFLCGCILTKTPDPDTDIVLSKGEQVTLEVATLFGQNQWSLSTNGGTAVQLSGETGLSYVFDSTNYNAGTYAVVLTNTMRNGAETCTWTIIVTEQTTTCTDNDNDGYSVEGGECGEADCNDNNSSVHPGATEVCSDGVDNDCNGLTDSEESACQTTVTHVDNPYEGALFYVNPEWSQKAKDTGGSAIANMSTGVWLDRIAAIEGTDNSQSNGPMGLRDHLNAALEQGGGQPIVAQFVIYNLPGRDCAALASNGELPATDAGMTSYKQDYIDPIAAIMADPKYSSVRIVTIVEIDSLPNLVTNTGDADVDGQCADIQSKGYYVEGIQYALSKLHPITNVYTYIDAAHHGWIGWDDNFNETAALLKTTVEGANGLQRLDGFITNTANYGALNEPYFEISETVRQFSSWIDWNRYADEYTFAQAFREKLVSLGFSSNIGMLIDTSRNGWGGDERPTGTSSSTDTDTMVEESRIDRRYHAGNWCNQSGAGIGERPQAKSETWLDAYVWIKPPGESDGSSSLIDNDDGKGFDDMCDPDYTGNIRNGDSMTGALPDAPISGAWFPAQFRQLLENAYPPIE